MPEKKIIKPVNYSRKSCDICSEDSAISTLGTRRNIMPARSELFEFIQHDSICETCGFTFNRDVPDEDFLNHYYRDAHTIKSTSRKIEPDFNSINRMVIISEYLSPGSSVYEVGASSGEFCETLTDNGYLAFGMDPLEKCNDKVEESSVNSRRTESAPGLMKFDCIAGYYVLEHITWPRLWINRLIEYLNPSGLLILEVPHFYRNPDESLYPEHMIHLTPAHLQMLLETSGFRILSIEEEIISRYFGFTIVARLMDPAEKIPSMESLLSRTDTHTLISRGRNAYKTGIASRAVRDERNQALGSLIKSRISSSDNNLRVYFWPANDISAQIAETIDNQENVIPLDKAETKIGAFYPGFKNPVQAPSLDPSTNHHRLFVLCSPAWNSDIKKDIEEMNLDDVSIIDGVEWTPDIRI